MKLIKFFGILFVLCVIGCVTTNSINSTSIPSGCEKSVLWQYKDQTDFTMQTAITGLKIYAIYNPADYALAQTEAKILISLLKNDGLTYDNILNDNNSKSFKVISIIITTYFKPGDVIDKCSKDLIISYLEMI